MDDEKKENLENLLAFLQNHAMDVNTVSSYVMGQDAIAPDSIGRATKASQGVIQALAATSESVLELLLSISLAYTGSLEAFRIHLNGGTIAQLTGPRNETLDEFNARVATEEFDKILKPGGKKH